jgi:cell fate (sporulation/competence/biofilm development) regulator YlbF (YheA/YmcA/DUF963 family)
MEDVLTRARELAEAIRGSERYRRLRALEEKVAGDEETQGLTRELEAARSRIAEKEKALRPVEVEEKRELARLQEQVRDCALLQELVAAQADFHEMMNRVNGTVRSVLEG